MASEIRRRAALAVLFCVAPPTSAGLIGCCCKGHCDPTYCGHFGKGGTCGDSLCPKGQTLAACPAYHSPGSTCDPVLGSVGAGCNCDAGAKKHCITPTPAPTPAPTAAPTAAPTSVPTAAPTQLCDFNASAPRCSFKLPDSDSSCSKIQSVLEQAMKCIKEDDCASWHRGCDCALSLSNSSCSFACGSVPGCAKESFGKRYLAVILALVFSAGLISCFAGIWYQRTRAKARSDDYDKRYQEWKGQQQPADSQSGDAGAVGGDGSAAGHVEEPLIRSKVRRGGGA